MNEERARVDFCVQSWYADSDRWQPQKKTAEWPDRVLLDHGALIDNKRVLNLGCFYPEDEEALADRAAHWVAIDFVPEVVARCKAHRTWPATVHFEVGDMRELRYADASFDVVTDFSSGDHLLREDWHRVIHEVHRVLRIGGHFLVCYANREAFEALGAYWKECGDRHGDYGYVRTDTRETMTAMLEERGFEVVRHSHDTIDERRSGMLAVRR